MARKSNPLRAEVVNMYETLFEFEGDDIDIQTIVEEIGVPRWQVAMWLRQAGYDVYIGHSSIPQKYSDQELQEIWDDYYERKMKVYEIVHKWEFSDASALYSLMRKLGWKTRTAEFKDEEANQMALDHAIELYDTTNMPVYMIQEETGVYPNKLMLEVRKRGIVIRRLRDQYPKTK